MHEGFIGQNSFEAMRISRWSVDPAEHQCCIVIEHSNFKVSNYFTEDHLSVFRHDKLLTIRDFLGSHVEFARHPIELGHSTDSLWDEALALVFGALALPPTATNAYLK